MSKRNKDKAIDWGTGIADMDEERRLAAERRQQAAIKREQLALAQEQAQAVARELAQKQRAEKAAAAASTDDAATTQDRRTWVRRPSVRGALVGTAALAATVLTVVAFVVPKAENGDDIANVPPTPTQRHEAKPTEKSFLVRPQAIRKAKRKPAEAKPKVDRSESTAPQLTRQAVYSAPAAPAAPAVTKQAPSAPAPRVVEQTEAPKTQPERDPTADIGTTGGAEFNDAPLEGNTGGATPRDASLSAPPKQTTSPTAPSGGATFQGR